MKHLVNSSPTGCAKILKAKLPRVLLFLPSELFGSLQLQPGRFGVRRSSWSVRGEEDSMLQQLVRCLLACRSARLFHHTPEHFPSSFGGWCSESMSWLYRLIGYSGTIANDVQMRWVANPRVPKFSQNCYGAMTDSSP